MLETCLPGAYDVHEGHLPGCLYARDSRRCDDAWVGKWFQELRTNLETDNGKFGSFGEKDAGLYEHGCSYEPGFLTSANSHITFLPLLALLPLFMLCLLC